jgi:tetratricopeptide (TPR) repeat protein
MPRMQVGDVVDGRFVIERRAGAGGMGAVYHASDRKTGAKVAIKVLHGHEARDIARFNNEVSVLSALEHPGIVRYIAHGATAEGARYLVMEWVDGEGLESRLARAGLGMAESVALVRAAAQALAVAHRRGVVHRDLKPSNLMLTGVARTPIKVLDFGIARAGQAHTTLTRTGIMVGTPGYMAPEQARGARDIDARADVFALGAVLFECLTGRPAFVGEHVMALLAKLLLEEPPRVSDLRPDVPLAIDELVARMLAKTREARPEDAAAVVAELDRLGALDGARAPVGLPRPEALTGSEHRLLCVIVAADQGSTGGSETSADTLSSEVLIDTLRRLREEILPHGARIDALALGGFLLTLEGAGSVADQAARAARCALGMRALLPALSIALVTGRGEISGRLPVGQVIDRACKLLTARVATGAGIRVDEVTRGLLDVRFEMIEGAAGWELRGERELGEETRTLLGRPTPCVGRDRELRTLMDLVEECAGEGVARGVLVTAAAGAGKTRIRHELVQRVRQRHPEVEIWQGRGDAISAGSTFALIGSALRNVAGILGGEPLALRQDKLRARVSRHVNEKERERVAMFLGEIAGTPFPDAESPKLRASRQNATVMADQIRLAWQDFVVSETLAHPVLLVIEDMHWGDLPSIKLIDRALAELSERPLLVLALARPEVHELFPRLWIERQVQEIRLGELGRRAAQELVRNALGSTVDPQRVADLVQRAAGNAFYLEELIRAVAEGRGEALPETVLGMAEARLLGLDPQARRVLRAASIFGETFWQRGVAALLGGEAGSTHAGSVLATLVEREVIHRKLQSRFPEEEEFAFRHALLREGAYAMLSEGDRALGHRLAAMWLAQAGESDPMILAEHFERGGAPSRAIEFYVRAAEQALRGYDCAAAVQRAERGIRCGAEGEVRKALISSMAEAYMHNGDLARAQDLFEEVLAISAPGSLSWCQAISMRLQIANRLGQAKPLLGIATTLLSVEPDREGAALFTCILSATTQVLLNVGMFDLAEAYFKRMQQIGEPLADREPLVRAWLDHGYGDRLYHQEDDWAALECFKRAAAGFEAVGSRPYATTAQAHMGYAYFRLGMYAESRKIAESLLLPGDAIPVQAFSGRLLLAMVKAVSESTEAAIASLSALVDFTIAHSLPWFLAIVRVAIARVLLLRRGDLDAAAREVQDAIALLATHPRNHMGALATFADIRLAQHRPAEALAIAEQALSVQRSLPPAYAVDAYPPLVHAEALHATGDHAGARELIAAMRAALLERTERIGDPAFRKSFLEAVPQNARLLARAKEWLGAAAE